MTVTSTFDFIQVRGRNQNPGPFKHYENGKSFGKAVIDIPAGASHH